MGMIVAAGAAGCDARALRYPLGVGAGGAAGFGAGGPGAGGVSDPLVPRETFEVVPTPTEKLDLLFVVDTSSSMGALQERLAADIPPLINVLMLPTADGNGEQLVDLHAAVVSADTGAGPYDLPDRGCRLGGDRGQFLSGPSDRCLVSPLGNQPAVRYLIASHNQQQKNYNGDIADALSCLIQAGTHGCMFSSPLKSARWALDPLHPPPGNQGFLRAGAQLSVIILSDQDDCSVPDDSTLMDPSQDAVSDPLGPFTTFRCDEFGYLCGVGGLLHPPSRTVPQMFNDCQTNASATAMLTRMADETAFLQGLKGDPRAPFVAALSGPATPYTTALQPRLNRYGLVEQAPQALPSCASNGVSAQPAVRLSNWAAAFGNHGLVQTVCANSLAPSLQLAATELGRLPAPACLSPATRDSIPSTPAVEPNCIVTDDTTDAAGRTVATPIPACGVDPNARNAPRPCWDAIPSFPCDGRPSFAVLRAVDAPPGAVTSVSCEVCPAGAALAGCP